MTARSMASTVSLYLILFVLFVLFYRRCYRSSKKPAEFRTTAECRAIIDGSQFPDARKNQLTRLEARALPNQPLIGAFGIKNAFTTGNEAEAKDFVENVRRLIEVSAVDWHGLAGALQCMLESIIEENRDGARVKVSLTPTVQALVLRESFWILFQMGEDAHLEFKQLADLGKITNSTWVRMKEERALEFKDNIVLQACLTAVFANHKTDINILDPGSNPLKLILPSFETVWRIVLRLFIVLHCHDNEDYKRALLEFVRDPTLTQFRLRPDNAVSVEFLVKEALRLYPPTRRIRRAFQFPGSSPNNQISNIGRANVEACHLNEEVWGPDALEFMPARWSKMSSVQRRSFLAFGGPPFLCPASHAFGPMVIGLLAGVMLDVFGKMNGYGKEWVLGSDDERDMSEVHSRERLRNERDAYGGLFLDLYSRRIDVSS
ncbi:uncharacterized protein ANIA_10435 [Aspergillus nidulans FGSC A4]|uniref:Cytochrome P450, putative (Eurofung) n=1 Tax=Emericella nidulans (strain FGSC A4 / ATCC 38163 / CBS 112.46 / NRRL 194 / M139) TaxID=227321 RepID=C8V3U6_EMENI|nr:hypothetical protein [Aspergillus nidulans FGSC A4]CBF75663.1 TPA: cytochrome P450, putative (Eurofung) [Aspergillus nidulans FGSC A4]